MINLFDKLNEISNIFSLTCFENKRLRLVNVKKAIILSDDAISLFIFRNLIQKCFDIMASVLSSAS